MDTMKYSDGYKYQLKTGYVLRVPIYPEKDIMTQFIHLSTGGTLAIMPGYAWDGASGPTIDTASTMVGALVHDALCQLMREKFLPRECFRRVNKIAYDLWIAGGMFRWRAWLWKRAIDSDTARTVALKPKKEYTAP